MSKELPKGIREMLTRAQALLDAGVNTSDLAATLGKFGIDLLKVFAECHDGADWHAPWITQLAPIASVLEEGECIFREEMDTESAELLEEISTLIVLTCEAKGKPVRFEGVNLAFKVQPREEHMVAFRKFWNHVQVRYGLKGLLLAIMSLKDDYPDLVIAGDAGVLQAVIERIEQELSIAFPTEHDVGSRLQ